MRSKWYLVLGNIILVAIVATLMLLFKDFSNTYSILAFVFLLITLLIPSIYIIICSITFKNKEALTNILAPSAIITFGFVVVNLIACIVMLCVNNLTSKGFWIAEMIIIGIYAILLCVIFAYTHYIKSINKGDKK